MEYLIVHLAGTMQYVNMISNIAKFHKDWPATLHTHSDRAEVSHKQMQPHLSLCPLQPDSLETP